MGRNLLKVPEDRGFAASVFNGYAFWYEGDWILKDWIDDSSPPELFRREAAGAGQVDVAAEHPEKTLALQQRFRSYYQASRQLSLQGRLFPRNEKGPGRPQPPGAPALEGR